MSKTYKHTGKLQIFDMYAPWMYIPIPKTKIPLVKPGGWGSIPVLVTIGKTTWKTSLFPAKDIGYFLPIKKPVARKENLKVGDSVTVSYSTA